MLHVNLLAERVKMVVSVVDSKEALKIMPTAELSPQANVCCCGLVRRVLDGGDGRNVYSWARVTHWSYWWFDLAMLSFADIA